MPFPFFFLVQMHRTQPLRCVVLRSALSAVSHERTNVSYTYYYRTESGASAAGVRAYTCGVYLRVVPG